MDIVSILQPQRSVTCDFVLVDILIKSTRLLLYLFLLHSNQPILGQLATQHWVKKDKPNTELS